MAVTFQQKHVVPRILSVYFYKGTGAPTDTPDEPNAIAFVEDHEVYRWDGTTWEIMLDGDLAITDHPATLCTGAAVGNHAQITTSSVSTGITASGADSASTTPKAVTQTLAGTGFATVGQVVTTSDNQTVGVDALANMWLITATQAPCLIVSNAACVAAPLVMTVIGLAPTTAAEAYQVHSGATHKHAAGAITITEVAHAHTGTPDAHVVTQPSTPILAHTVTP